MNNCEQNPRMPFLLFLAYHNKYNTQRAETISKRSITMRLHLDDNCLSIAGIHLELLKKQGDLSTAQTIVSTTVD